MKFFLIKNKYNIQVNLNLTRSYNKIIFILKYSIKLVEYFIRLINKLKIKDFLNFYIKIYIEKKDANN